VLPEVLFELHGVQAVRNMGNVRETNGTRWIDVPGVEDLYTSVYWRVRQALAPFSTSLPVSGALTK
jgi:hypothetical protein